MRQRVLARTALFGAALLFALFVATQASLAPAGADRDDESSRRAEEWRLALADLLAREGSFDVAELQTLDRRLPAFDAEALEAQATSERVNQLAEAQGNRVRHALRSLAYYRRVGGLLERGPSICVLLGATDDAAWSRALKELCREPFGERLGNVAERLSADSHGPVRIMAGRIANYLNAFCGGRGSAWGARLHTGWDPTPLVRRIAKRLLDDRNPAVACAFATFDAYALEDTQIVDSMVVHLNDERQTPCVSRGLLWTQERTVGDACRDTLNAQFIFYRKPLEGGPRIPSEPALRRVQTLPAGGTPAGIKDWWSGVREQWSFTPDGEGWESLLDHLLVLRRGQVVDVDTTRGKVSVRLSEYAEHRDSDSPELTIHVEVDKPDAIHLGLGNPQHHIGYAGWSMTTAGLGWNTGSCMYAPATADGVRIRVRVYVAASAR